MFAPQLIRRTSRSKVVEGLANGLLWWHVGEFVTFLIPLFVEDYTAIRVLLLETGKSKVRLTLDRDSFSKAESANSSQRRILTRNASSALSGKIIDR